MNNIFKRKRTNEEIENKEQEINTLESNEENVNKLYSETSTQDSYRQEVENNEQPEEDESKIQAIKENVLGKTMHDLWNGSAVFKIFCVVVLALFGWYLYVASGLHGFIIAASISLVPFVVGFLLALLPHPLTIKLQRMMTKRKIEKARAAGVEPKINSRLSLKISGFIVFIINMGILVGLLYLVVPLVWTQLEGFNRTLQGEEFYGRLERFLEGMGINIEDGEIAGWYKNLSALVAGYFADNGFAWFSTTSSVMMNILMGFAIGFYLIHDWKNYSDAVIDVVYPHKTVEAKEKDRELRGKIKVTLISWSKGFMLDQTFIFTLTAILLYFIGTPEWFILALLMVLLNTIPFIGPIIGGVIIVGFLFVNNVNGVPVEHMRGWWTIDSLAVIIIGSVGIFTIQTVESIWWIPKVYNKTLNIHPATILLALGLTGIMISPFVLPLVIPSIAVAKTVYKHKTGREVRL